MKTFDEAFQKINEKSRSTLLTADLDGAREYLENDAWVRLIELTAHDLLLKTAACNDLQDAMTQICAHLHTIYSLGVLTGMEMEKE